MLVYAIMYFHLLNNLVKLWCLKTFIKLTILLVRGGGVGPQMNKFEQGSSDDHQISVAGERVCPGGYPYHVNYPMMHMMLLPTAPPPPNRMTDRPVKTLPSRNFVCGR